MSKTFEGATRADAQSADPLKLCIIGGRALPKDEQGPLDTDLDESHPLHAHDLLRPLKQSDVDDVFEHGVINVITVIRLNNIPVVETGRGRVRKARLANIRRKIAGLDPIEIKFVVIRITDGLLMMNRMISENLNRKDFGVEDRIALAKQLLARGASEEVVARRFEVKPTRFKQWLNFEDNASPSVRAALKQGRMKPSTAIVLAELDHPAQDAKLAELLTAPKPTARAARRLVRSAQGKEEVIRPRLPEQKKLLTRIGHARGNDWMQGAKAALLWVTGESVHKDLRTLLEEEVIETPKKTTKTKE
jgi:transposase-like protein